MQKCATGLKLPFRHRDPLAQMWGASMSLRFFARQFRKRSLFLLAESFALDGGTAAGEERAGAQDDDEEGPEPEDRVAERIAYETNR